MYAIRKLALIIAIIAVGLNMTSYGRADDQEALTKSIVDHAVTVFQEKVAEKGKDYALKLMNSMSGQSALGARKGPIYCFVCSSANDQVIILAHPANKAFKGKNLINFKGAKGKPFPHEFLRVVNSEAGKGWVDYWWRRHGENTPTLKRTYVARVPGEKIFIGAGYYIE